MAYYNPLKKQGSISSPTYTLTNQGSFSQMMNLNESQVLTNMGPKNSYKYSHGFFGEFPTQKNGEVEMFNFEDYELGNPSRGVDVAQLLLGNTPPMGIARSWIASPAWWIVCRLGGGVENGEKLGGIIPFGCSIVYLSLH